MSTFIPSGKDIKRKWFVLDASGKTLGRLSTQAAVDSGGKNNVLYTPYIDMGDHVIVVNCGKDCADRDEGPEEGVSAVHGLSGRVAGGVVYGLIKRRPETVWSKQSRACCRSPRWAGRWARS